MKPVFFGALSGVFSLSLELNLLARSDLGTPNGALLARSIGLYLLIGGFFGGWSGLVKTERADRSCVFSALWFSWLLSARAGDLGLSFGLHPAPVAFGLALGASLVASVGVSFLNDSGKKGRVAGTLLLWSTLLFTVNLHCLGSPLSPLAIFVDLVLLAISALFTVLLMWLLRGVSLSSAFAGLVLISGLGAFVSMGPPPPRSPAPHRSEHPPVVLIVVDTLRADHLGAYGYSSDISPNIDAFFHDSVRFERAYSTAPWTLPSTASLLTGLSPEHHGAGLNDGSKNVAGGLRSDVHTLAELLGAHGYTSLGVVSNPWLGASFGFSRGFDVYDDAVSASPMLVALKPLRAWGLDRIGWPAFRSAEAITDRGLDFIAEQGAGGWFLFVHYMDVHGPHPASDGETLLQRYDRAISRVDRSLGRLLKEVPRGAWVVLTSDHGEELDEGRPREVGVPRSARHGHQLHEELLSVPLLIRAPDGRSWVDGRLTRSVDLVPTLLDGLGLHSEAPLDGRSLFQDGPQLALLSQSIHYGAEQQSVRSERYRLTRFADGRAVLYDLRDDPLERHPLDPSILGTRRAALEAAFPPMGSGASLYPEPLSHELRGFLKRVGYVD